MSTVPTAPTVQAPTALSLFSGAGGDTLGLEQAGFKVIAFNEFNKAAIQTHKANFPDSVLLQNEKGETDINKVPSEVFAAYRNKVNIVFAGFPCQGFSRAGKKNASDPRNQMFRQFVRVVKETQPQFVIGENVTGLVKMKSGPNEDDPLMLDLILEAFREIGYELTYQVLEATDFGVPQKRKRILLIGWKKEGGPHLIPSEFWPAITAEGAKQKAPMVQSFVRAVLENAYLLKEDEVPEGFDANAIPVPSIAKVSGKPHPFIALKAGEKLLSCTKRDSPVHSEVMDLKKPSKTIICTYDHQPRLLVGLKKGTERYVRCLLPDELKQIQGFPKDFQVLGNEKEKVVQIGNAVPPGFVRAVATVLRRSL
jgi:DNA (cytosine-5)-methyltransferase 1